MKRTEEASGHKIDTWSVHIVRDRVLMIGQDFTKSGAREPDLKYFVTLGPEDIKLLLPEFQEILRHEEIHVKYSPDCKDGCVCEEN